MSPASDKTAIEELLGAYALDALDPDEIVEVEAALALDPELAREADRLVRAPRGSARPRRSRRPRRCVPTCSHAPARSAPASTRPWRPTSVPPLGWSRPSEG